MQLIQRKHESGASLVVGLVLLLVATLVVFAGVRGTQMQERMTSNLNNKAISLKAAEAGASDFLAWIQEELDNGGWPEQADYEASDLPKDAQSSVAVINDVLSGQYWFEDVVWDPAFVTFVAIGDADGLAESRVRVRVNAPGGEPPGGLEPPAALSCFGGPCSVGPGAGKSQIDGHNYDLPPADCSGRGSCFDPILKVGEGEGDVRDPYRVPGVYFDNYASSAPGGTGKTASCKYTGLPASDPNSTDQTAENTDDGCNDSTFYAGDELYPGGEPSSATYFGEGTIGKVESGATDENGDPVFGTREDPKITYIDEYWKESGGDNTAGLLIVDGKKYFEGGTFDPVLYDEEEVAADIAGNLVFEGIVLIKNCGKLRMRGTAFVYGAVIIDATGCPTDYDPFDGRGTPNIRYSFDGLGAAGKAFGEGTGLRVVSWLDSLL